MIDRESDKQFFERAYQLVAQSGHPRPATANQIVIQCLGVYGHVVKVNDRDVVLDVILGRQPSQHWLLFVTQRHVCAQRLRKNVEARIEPHVGFQSERVFAWTGPEVGSFLSSRRIPNLYRLSVAYVPVLNLLPSSAPRAEPVQG